MRIGELSRRTTVPVRMLRYYEQQGLLSPRRRDNGYREYDEADVDRAALVSSLVRSGLSTRLITAMLERSAAGGSRDPAPDLDALFTAEAERLDRRIACLTFSRDTVREHLARGVDAGPGGRPARPLGAASAPTCRA